MTTLWKRFLFSIWHSDVGTALLMAALRDREKTGS